MSVILAFLGIGERAASAAEIERERARNLAALLRMLNEIAEPAALAG